MLPVLGTGGKNMSDLGYTQRELWGLLMAWIRYGSDKNPE